MTVLVYKDGRLVTDDKGPIEGSLEGLLMILADAKDGDTITYNGSVWTNIAPKPVLYAEEADGADSTTVLTATYAMIKAAVEAGRGVYVVSIGESEETVLTPLGSYGGDDETGYTVTAGSNTYTATTANGILTKQEGEG